MELVLWLVKFYQTVVVTSLIIPIIILVIIYLWRYMIRRKLRYRDKPTDTVIQIDIDDPIIIAKIENLENMLDITNKQIIQQNELLGILEHEFKYKYDHVERNEIMGNILKTKANILKLTAKSDKIGFDINKIGKEYYYGCKIRNNR